jgi:hypothetical protein
VALQLPAGPLEGDPTRKLRESGANVIAVRAYDLTPPDALASGRRLVRAVAQRRVSAVTFTSRAAVRSLVDVARAEGLEADVLQSLRESVVVVAVGITDDGTFIGFARFADAASAKANADRPEQTAWFEETRKFFDEDPSFRESSDVTELLEGGSDRAGFVQVMEGSVSDRPKAEAMETPELLDQLRAARPDLIGSLRVWFDSGTFAEAAYFTSEADARKGEASAEFNAPQEDLMALYGEMTFLDLRDPILT